VLLAVAKASIEGVRKSGGGDGKVEGAVWRLNRGAVTTWKVLVKCAWEAWRGCYC